MEVTLRVATAADLTVLREMVDDYRLDLLPCYPGGVTPPRLSADAWMGMAATKTLLIVAGGAVVGFAVTMFQPCLPGVAGNYLAELFVHPASRKTVTAMKAARAVVQAQPGHWTADVLAGNKAGLRFALAMSRRVAIRHGVRAIETPYGSACRFRFEVGA